MMQVFKDDEEVGAEQLTGTAVPQFDPNKKYRWTPETQFVLNGADFAGLLNSMRAIISTEQAQTILSAQQSL